MYQIQSAIVVRGADDAAHYFTYIFSGETTFILNDMRVGVVKGNERSVKNDLASDLNNLSSMVAEASNRWHYHNRRTWWRKYDSSQAYKRKQWQYNQGYDQDKHFYNSQGRKEDDVHSVMVCGVYKLDRPYGSLRHYLRESYGLTPSDIEINQNSFGDLTGTAAVHFPINVDISRLLEKTVHTVYGRRIKISPLRNRRPPSKTINPILNKNIGSIKHRQRCILGRLTNDSWYLIIAHLEVDDLFRFQMVCSCARNVTNLFFGKKRTEFTFDYNEMVKNHHKEMPILQNTLMDYTNIMNAIMRYNLSKVVSMTIDMQSAHKMELESDFFKILKKHCPKLKHLKIKNALLSTWKTAPFIYIPLESLELRNEAIHCYSRTPLLTEESAKAFFTASMTMLTSLKLWKWSPDRNAFKYLPENLVELTLSGHFDELPTQIIAERLPNLRIFTLKVNSRGLSMAMTHHHFLKFDVLEELHLRGYPIYYDSQWVLPTSMRVAYFVPGSVTKLTVSKMGLSGQDVNMITTYCPYMKYLKLKYLPAEAEEVDFKPLACLETLIIDNCGSTFPIIVGNLPEHIQVVILRNCPAYPPEIVRLIHYVHRSLLDIRSLEMGFEAYLWSDEVLMVPDKHDTNFEVFEYGTTKKANEIRFSRQYTINQQCLDGNRQWILSTAGQWDTQIHSASHGH